jgi:hypothetical protein
MTTGCPATSHRRSPSPAIGSAQAVPQVGDGNLGVLNLEALNVGHHTPFGLDAERQIMPRVISTRPPSASSSPRHADSGTQRPGTFIVVERHAVNEEMFLPCVAHELRSALLVVVAFDRRRQSHHTGRDRQAHNEGGFGTYAWAGSEWASASLKTERWAARSLLYTTSDSASRSRIPPTPGPTNCRMDGYKMAMTAHSQRLPYTAGIWTRSADPEPLERHATTIAGPAPLRPLGHTTRTSGRGGRPRCAVHGQGSLPSATNVKARSLAGHRVRASTVVNGRIQTGAVDTSPQACVNDSEASAIAACTRTAHDPQRRAGNPKVAPTRPGGGDHDASIDRGGIRLLTPDADPGADSTLWTSAIRTVGRRIHARESPNR